MNLEYKEEDVLRYDEEYKYIDMIKIPELHEITIDILNEHSDKPKLEEANEVANALVQLLKHKGLLTETSQQSFIDVILVANMIHNIYFDEEDITTLFKARQELESCMVDKNINDQVREAIFATVEGQLGEKTPIATVKPNPNTPTELFGLAVWMVKKFNK